MVASKESKILNSHQKTKHQGAQSKQTQLPALKSQLLRYLNVIINYQSTLLKHDDHLDVVLIN